MANYEIEKLIAAIRESDEYIPTIYTQGSCYKFFLLLKKLYPSAVPVKNKSFDHVGALVDGECYDINGKCDWDWYMMDANDIHVAEKWSFRRHHMLKIGECSVCDEPFVV